jgi:hypothetical protein
MRRLMQFVLFTVVFWLPVTTITTNAQVNKGVNLGSVSLGSSTTTLVPVTFSSYFGGPSPLTIASISVVTKGAVGLDFTSSGAGTCKVGMAYTAGQSCTVGVIFKPLYAGPRYGAVVVHNATDILTTTFLQGMGDSPQIGFTPNPSKVFTPTIQDSLGNTTGLSFPGGIAIDGTGTLYLTTSNAAGIVEIPASGAAFQSDPEADGTLVSGTLGLTVDGAGNLYLLDVDHERVVEVRSGGSSVEFFDEYDTLPALTSVGVDGAGNVFIADWDNATLVEYPNGSGNTNPLVITPTANGEPIQEVESIAFDSANNIYLADSTSGHVVKLTTAQIAASGGDGTVINPVINGAPLNQASAVAVDGADNLFIASSTGLVKVPADGSSPSAVDLIVNNKTTTAWALAFDLAGNLFLADAPNNRAIELLRSQPPASVGFLSSSPGQRSADSPKTVQVENVGTQPLVFSGIEFPSDFPEDLNGANACAVAQPLDSGKNCSLNIDSIPTVSGTLIENITLTDNSLNISGSKQNIQLSNEYSALLSVSSSTLSFGGQTLNTQSASQQVALTNTGKSPLSITGIQIGGPQASSFIFSPDCPSTLATGSSCILHGHFAPSSTVGPNAASIFIYNNGAVSPQKITLSGTGLNLPAVSFAPEAYITWGYQEVGTETDSQQVIMTNTGQTPLSIYSMRVTGTNASEFIIASDCPTRLMPSATCRIHGHFAPTVLYGATASYTITDDAPNSPQSLFLGANGISQPATVSLSANALNFGNQPIGTSSASQTMTLTNPSLSTANIARIQIGGPDASSFGFGTTCGPLLTTGENCMIHGHFTPQTVGSKTASVIITYLGAAPAQTITLTGIGQ